MTPFAKAMHQLLDQIMRPTPTAVEVEQDLRTIRRMTRLQQRQAGERRKAA